MVSEHFALTTQKSRFKQKLNAIHFSLYICKVLLLKRLKEPYPSAWSPPIILDSLLWTWSMRRSLFKTCITQGDSEMRGLPEYYLKIYFILYFAVGAASCFVYTIQSISNMDKWCLFNNVLGWLRRCTHKLFLAFVLMYWSHSLITIIGQFDLFCSWICSHIAWPLSVDILQVHNFVIL